MCVSCFVIGSSDKYQWFQEWVCGGFGCCMFHVEHGLRGCLVLLDCREYSIGSSQKCVERLIAWSALPAMFHVEHQW